jgi:cytochrome P450
MTTLAATPADLVDPDLHATDDPHELWRWMREHSPVHRHPQTDLPAFWSLTRYEDVRAVYRDPATFSSARGVLLRPVDHGDDPGGGLTLALTDPPRHKQLRSLVAAWFTERTARGLEDSIRTAVRATLRKATERPEFDFVHDVAGRLSIYVICHLLGVPDSDHEAVFTWTNEAYAAHTPLASQQELMEYFGELMYQRMEEPADDIVSALANGLPAGDLLTEEEILLNCENLIGATENGRLAIAGGVLATLGHPEQWERLRADRSLLPSAVEEMLRWTSSATHSMRSTTRETEIRGQRIPAGEWVVLWVPSANRDEAVFADPYRFDVGRAPNRHLALGIGEHFCLGATMARTQMRVLLTELLDLPGEIELCGPVERVRSTAVSGPERLPLRVAAR